MILLILLLAIILRLINLDQSLWLDEAINVVYAKSNDFWWFVTKYPIGDFHPPGYFALIWVWGNIFNFSEIIIRLPSVFFGVLTVLLTYLIGLKLYSKSIGLTGALLLSLAPLHIYYSQEARMYSYAAFAVTLSYLFLLKFLKGEKFSLLGYAFSVSLVLYSDYLAYFVFPSQLLFVFIYHRKLLKKYLSSIFLGFLPFLLWLPILPKQLKSGIETAHLVSGWREVVGGVGLKEGALLPIKILLGRITFENKLVYASVLALISIPYALVLRKILTALEQTKYLLFWLLIPTTLAFVVSMFLPIFSYFRMIFILPAFYLLMAFGLEKYKPKFKITLLILIVTSEIFATSLYMLNTDFQREDWKGAVQFINRNSDSDTLVLNKNNELLAPFRYYKNSSVQSIPAFKKIPVSTSSDLNDLEKKLESYSKIFVFNYLVDITDPNRILDKEIEELGFRRVREYDFRGVGFIYEFEK